MGQEKMVGEIMKYSWPVEVESNCSMRELASVFVQNVRDKNCDPTVVVREGDFIVGMIGRSDFLNALEPHYAKKGLKMEIFWQGLFSQRWHEIAHQPVEKFMRPSLVVNIDDNLMKVAHIMNANKADVVLVAKNSELVGSIAAEELISELVDNNLTGCTQDIVNA